MSVPPRTTPAAVIDILQVDYDALTSPPLTGYIETASNIIDGCVICASQKKVPLTTTTQELMERWLAAHLYVSMDQTYKGRATLRASGQFQGMTGMMLMASKYGQMAVASDPSGCLNNVDKQSRVRAFWGGKSRCRMLPWWMRDGCGSPFGPCD